VQAYWITAFLCTKGLNAKDIHREIFPGYCEKCLSRKALHNWVEKLSQGRSKIAHNGRSDAEVAEAIVKNDFYAAGLDAIVNRSNKRINVGGGYIEKYISS
jgi:hypothetical protein